jgi:hypothetical protein
VLCARESPFANCVSGAPGGDYRSRAVLSCTGAPIAVTAFMGLTSCRWNGITEKVTRPRRQPPTAPLSSVVSSGALATKLMRVRVGLVILPSDRWAEARRQWEWADRAGFHTAWTYDHIRWGGMPDGPWHAAVPVLAAAAAVTERVRLGTLVATPNFRHPVTLARDALALDDVSDGRLDLGLGPGSEGPDATALGQEAWTRAERLARFEEFLQVLQPIVDGGPATRTSLQTTHYTAAEVPRPCGSPPSTDGTGSPSAPPDEVAARPRMSSRRSHASSPFSTRPAAPPAGTRRASAGPCCGRRPNRSSPRSTSSTSSSAPVRSSASTSSSCTTPPRRGRTRGTSRRSSGLPSGPPAERQPSEPAQPAKADATAARTAARADAGFTRSTSHSVHPTHEAASAMAPPTASAASGRSSVTCLATSTSPRRPGSTRPTMRVPSSTGMAK